MSKKMSRKKEKDIFSSDQNFKRIIQDTYSNIQFTGKEAVFKRIEENDNQKTFIPNQREKRMKRQFVTDLVLAGSAAAAAVAIVIVLQLNQIYTVPEISRIELVNSEELILAGDRPFALIQLASIEGWEIE